MNKLLTKKIKNKYPRKEQMFLRRTNVRFQVMMKDRGINKRKEQMFGGKGSKRGNKKFFIFFKNLLTNNKRCDIINTERKREVENNDEIYSRTQVL